LAASEVVRYRIVCERFCLSGIIKNSRIKERKTVAQNTEVVFGVIKRLIESKGVAKRSSVLNNSNLSGGAREMNTVIETLVEAKRIEEIKEGRNTFYKIVQDV
jgi:predicted transcriptional regulator